MCSIVASDIDHLISHHDKLEQASATRSIFLLPRRMKTFHPAFEFDCLHRPLLERRAAKAPGGCAGNDSLAPNKIVDDVQQSPSKRQVSLGVAWRQH
jgi:hypothetical protein